MRRPARPAYIILTLSIIVGCKDATLTPRDNLADAYAEILMASSLHREDTIRRRAILDSIATNFGFSDQKEVLSEIHRMTLDPVVLRKVLDSTENRLKSLKEAKNGKGPG